MINENTVFYSGNLTFDPELKKTQSGKSVCTVRVANNYRYGTAENRKEDVTYLDVETWDATADFVGSLKKGEMVYIKGRLKQESWDDKNTGEKRSKLKVVANSVQRVLPKAADESSPSSAPAPTPSGATGARANSGPLAPTGYGSAPVADDEEIPF